MTTSTKGLRQDTILVSINAAIKAWIVPGTDGNLAVHRQIIGEDPCGYWVVSHVPTGLGLPGSCAKRCDAITNAQWLWGRLGAKSRTRLNVCLDDLAVSTVPPRIQSQWRKRMGVEENANG